MTGPDLPPATEGGQPPPPARREPGVAALNGLFALALLYTLYFASGLIIPVVVALLFALLLTPLVNALQRFHVPRALSALLLLACIGGPIALLGMELAEPAQKWAKRLPELGMQLTEEFDSFTDSLAPEEAPAPEPAAAKEEDEGFTFFGLFGGDDEEEPAPQPPPENRSKDAVKERLVQGGLEFAISLASATPLLIVQLLTFLILVLFQLIFGQGLFRTAVQVIPGVRDKRQANLLVGRVQKELSRYILTVSLINTGLGMATAFALWLLQVEDALLWGAVVGLLNFAPYVGPLVAACILGVAGVVQYGLDPGALIPAATYLAINLVEAQFVTPLVLGRHMRLNPLVLVLWILVWGWLWGAAGVLLSVPLLVCLKLAAQQLDVLRYWVELIEARG